MAQAAKCVTSSTLSLERVRAIRFPNGRRLPVLTALFTKGTLLFTRFELGSPVSRYSPGDKFLRGALYVRICSSKGQHSTDDGSPSCNSPSLPPNGPSRTSDEVDSPDCADAALVGEDAAAFDITSQSTSSWLLFTAILSVLLAILYVVWIDPETGYGNEYIDAVSSLTGSHEMVMLIILFTFTLVHSGLASLRGAGEQLIGERAYRLIYAASSFPLAVSAVANHLFYDQLLENRYLKRLLANYVAYVYFMNHRYDGVQLWDVRSVFGVREIVWAMSFISFFFVYPSTYNMLEVAAINKPKVHMWKTGVMRITRHPQMVGQFLWCFAHTLWIGNSFTMTTSVGLLAHHFFGVWHGDKRLTERHGEAYRILKERTSVLPFAAILDGRQILPRDYCKEFLRVPYFVTACLTIGAYWSQPLLQSASQYLRL